MIQGFTGPRGGTITFSTMTLSITAVSFKDLIVTLSINNIDHIDTGLVNVISAFPVGPQFSNVIILR